MGFDLSSVGCGLGLHSIFQMREICKSLHSLSPFPPRLESVLGKKKKITSALSMECAFFMFS